MKKIYYFILITLSLISSCDSETPCPTCEHYSDAFVIGFDPCTANSTAGESSGYVISVPERKDTVVAYNFPTDIYEFPLVYFENYVYNPFFPDSAKYDFPIKIKYRYVKENEKTPILCRGDILLYDVFLNNQNEVKILSITK